MTAWLRSFRKEFNERENYDNNYNVVQLKDNDNDKNDYSSYSFYFDSFYNKTNIKISNGNWGLHFYKHFIC